MRCDGLWRAAEEKEVGLTSARRRYEGNSPHTLDCACPRSSRQARLREGERNKKDEWVVCRTAFYVLRTPRVLVGRVRKASRSICARCVS